MGRKAMRVADPIIGLMVQVPLPFLARRHPVYVWRKVLSRWLACAKEVVIP